MKHKNISIPHSKFVISGLIILVVSAVYLLFFSKPVRVFFELNRELVLVESKLVEMEKALYRRGQVEALCKKFEERILATGSDAEELGFLLKELESLTRAEKVDIKRIRPLPSQWVGNYRKFFVSLEVQARLQNMFELLYAIDTSPKILTVESLKIQALRTAPNLLSGNILISRTSAGARELQENLPE